MTQAEASLMMAQGREDREIMDLKAMNLALRMMLENLRGARRR